jgi:hypothetical protein
MTELIVYRTDYQAQSARDARDRGYGGKSYWDYLEQSALERCARYLLRGDAEAAERMLTRTLGDALAGNNGD